MTIVTSRLCNAPLLSSRWFCGFLVPPSFSLVGHNLADFFCRLGAAKPEGLLRQLREKNDEAESRSAEEGGSQLGEATATAS